MSLYGQIIHKMILSPCLTSWWWSQDRVTIVMVTRSMVIWWHIGYGIMATAPMELWWRLFPSMELWWQLIWLSPYFYAKKIACHHKAVLKIGCHHSSMKNAKCQMSPHVHSIMVTAADHTLTLIQCYPVEIWWHVKWNSSLCFMCYLESPIKKKIALDGISILGPNFSSSYR